MAPHLELPVRDGGARVTLRSPSGEQLGWWNFSHGGTLLVDLLDPAVCRVDGRTASAFDVVDDFIPWPRMTVEVDGTPTELVTADREVLRRHYNRPAHQEVGYCGRPDPLLTAFHAARIAQCRRLLRGITGRVADVGSGYSMVSMAGPWSFELFACDRDPGAMRSVRDGRLAGAVLGAADEVPLRPGWFDAVYAGEIVEHLAHPYDALAQWVRLLKPGGRLVVTTPNRRHLMARLLHREVVQNPEHLFEWSRDELLDAVRAAGGRVRHVEGLHLPIPVPVPGMGWRDVIAGVNRRVPVPPMVARAGMELGRRAPRFAMNVAVVAEPV